MAALECEKFLAEQEGTDSPDADNEVKKGKPPRTHWDMLLERRSIKELEVLLAERLEHLRSGPAPAKAAAGSRTQRKSA